MKLLFDLKQIVFFYARKDVHALSGANAFARSLFPQFVYAETLKNICNSGGIEQECDHVLHAGEEKISPARSADL